MNKSTKYILIGITIWIILQITRFIAVPIVQDVLAGIDDGEWMYPAILDIVVAILSPIAIYFLWKRRNAEAWAFLLVYFVISIIDHGNAYTAAALARVPQTFIKMGAQEAGNTPLIQAFVDIFCIYLLSRVDIRKYFGLINSKNV